MRNALLIVLYKKDIYTSQSIQSFLEAKPLDTELTIWDNSSTPLPEDQLQLLNTEIGECKYCHTPANLSLSKIYNKFLDTNKDKCLLHIFDDDSNFSVEYFDLMKQAYLEYKEIGLFAPQIVANNRVVSPGYFKLYKGGYFDRVLPGLMSTKNTLIITSGMTISPNGIGELRFDESLHFYGIDTLFSLEYSDMFDKLYVINYRLKHELSRFAKEPVETKLRRLESYRSSDLYILNKRKKYIGFFLSALSYIVKIFMLQIKRIK